MPYTPSHFDSNSEKINSNSNYLVISVVTFPFPDAVKYETAIHKKKTITAGWVDVRFADVG